MRTADVPVMVDCTKAHKHHEFAGLVGWRLLNGSCNGIRSAAAFNEQSLVRRAEPVLVRRFRDEFEQNDAMNLPNPAAGHSASATAFEVLPRELSAYRQGNVGVDYVHRFESGQPGPHVLINALTHGNEICGMAAATHLLDSGVRPLIGTLTVSFANVAAYESFDAARPFESRQLVHNMNRIWSADWLDGAEQSPELARARAMRAVVDAADHILDIHSTSQDVQPFWVYPAYVRNGDAARALGLPSIHLLMPQGLGSGTPLIQYGRHASDGPGPGVALVVECDQHFRRSAADLAVAVSLDFLAHFGLLAPRVGRVQPPPQKRYELLQTHMVHTPDFRFVRPLVGFESFAEGELIATDGARRIMAPCDRCTVFMPTREPIVGREAVYLTRPLAD